MVDPVDTIAAIATATGQAAVGMIRISGPRVPVITESMLGRLPAPRMATLSHFMVANGEIIDQGLALYFPAPYSFTGESVLELQGHGSPIILDKLLSGVCALGARLAEPGEFSQRAFLNGRLDLVQAEAIADLICSRTEQAAAAALQSLRGSFSTKLQQVIDCITTLRVQIEADIDFPDEEIPPSHFSRQQGELEALSSRLAALLEQATPTVLYEQGLRIVLAGAPNAGKSSLLNALLEEQRAIVSPEPGTTRDVLTANQHLNGVPVEFVDTAGVTFGHSVNKPVTRQIGIVEQEGIRRAHQAIASADVVLHIIDDHLNQGPESEPLQAAPDRRIITVVNKIDLSGRDPGLLDSDNNAVAVSALTGSGLEQLQSLIIEDVAQFSVQRAPFLARRRHIEAMKEAQICLQRARLVAADVHQELVAEDLRQAQNALGTITGAVTSDDLLGEIFSSFCIGK